MLAAKEARRVHLGAHFTLLFENRLTVRYQIQEMMRVERIVREADIQHEIDTYNELLGGPGEIGCSLLIEIDDPAERAVKLMTSNPLAGDLLCDVAIAVGGAKMVPFLVDRAVRWRKSKRFPINASSVRHMRLFNVSAGT